MIDEKGRVYYNHQQKELLKKCRIRGFFYKKFKIFRNKFNVEIEKSVLFEYENIKKKYEILYSAPKYSFEKLLKTKFLVEREIRNYENSKLEKKHYSNFLIGSMAVMFAIIPIILDGLSGFIYSGEVSSLDNGMVRYYLSFGMIILVFMMFSKLPPTLNANDSNLKITNEKIYDENLLRLECLNNEIGRRKKLSKE